MFNWTHAMAHEENLKEIRRQVAREQLAERARPARQPGGKGLAAWVLYIVFLGFHAVGKVLRI